MSPRILDLDGCPHCKTPLGRPTPRMCPHCGGSLQKRHLSAGCLSSAPKLLLFALALWCVVRELRQTEADLVERDRTGVEAVAFEHERP